MRTSYYISKAKEHTWRIIYFAFCFAWLAFLFIFGITKREYVLDHAFLTIALPVGGVSALIMGLKAFFRGYGFLLSCFWGLLGFFSSYIPIFVLRYVNMNYPSLFIGCVAVFTLIYMLICHLTGYRGDRKSDSQLINEVMGDDIKSQLIEPLYYTFKQKSFKFKGSKFNMLDDVTNQVRTISGESVLHYILWSLMFVMLVGEMIILSPSLLGKQPNLDNMKEKINPSGVMKKLQKDAE